LTGEAGALRASLIAALTSTTCMRLAKLDNRRSVGT
jgi:hypothetical protein